MQPRNGQRSVVSPRSSVNATALFNSATSLGSIGERKGLVLRLGLKKKLDVLSECRSLPVLAVKKSPQILGSKGEKSRKNCNLTLQKTSEGFDSDDSVINELAEILSIPSPRFHTQNEELTVPIQRKPIRKIRLRTIIPKSPRAVHCPARPELCYTSRASKEPRPY